MNLPYFETYIKIVQRCITVLNIKDKILRITEENKRTCHHSSGVDKIFLRYKSTSNMLKI